MSRRLQWEHRNKREGVKRNRAAYPDYSKMFTHSNIATVPPELLREYALRAAYHSHARGRAKKITLPEIKWR